jgi:2-polyprenyl-6-methoxyphenol hydroxylase-like FAD-dependent oxidoreductase
MGEPRVIIVGAGPTGLILANLLGDAHVQCLLVERRAQPPAESRAIGVTPPSLDLLESMSLADTLIDRGVLIRDAIISDGRSRLGSLTFRHLPGPYPFILSVQQSETMGLLEERLRELDSVRYCQGEEFLDLTTRPEGVDARLRDLETGEEHVESGELLIGCDGNRSTVHKAAGIPYTHKSYGVSFFMADFTDETDMGSDAVLFFTTEGAVESFPLPGGLRRWVAQTDAGPDGLTRVELIDHVRRRTGTDLSEVASTNVSWWQPERLRCLRLSRGPVLLCGDAAHVMSPIGGQGMNTGLADAELAAHVVARHLRGGSWDKLCATYDRRRSRAFRVAADHAALGMWLGTRTGLTARIRSPFLKYFLLGTLFAKALPRHFAMLTIPHGRMPGRATQTPGGERR